MYGHGRVYMDTRSPAAPPVLLCQFEADSFFDAFCRSRLALWRRHFLKIQGHLNGIFKLILVIPE